MASPSIPPKNFLPLKKSHPLPVKALMEEFCKEKKIAKVVQALLFAPTNKPWSYQKITGFFPDSSSSVSSIEEGKKKIVEIQRVFEQEYIPFMQSDKGVKTLSYTARKLTEALLPHFALKRDNEGFVFLSLRES